MSMDMGSMTMSMPSSTGSMAMSSATGMTGMSGINGMAMTFFQATDTPLYSKAWTPGSTGTYAATCIFLIILATILRGLFAFKYALEQFWTHKALQTRLVFIDDVDGQSTRSTENLQTGGRLDKTMSPSEKTNAASSRINGLTEQVKVVEGPRLAGPGKSYQPWRLSVDLPRALLVGIMVSIGYLLMLAVMTYNVGYFLSVVSGSFLGELLMGRFHNSVLEHDH